jgi:hypothetical protein
LKKGGATQFKFSDKNDEYIIIAVEDIEKDDKPTAEFGVAISRHVERGAANDIMEISVESFKKQMPVDVKEKLITKAVNDIERYDESD